MILSFPTSFQVETKGKEVEPSKEEKKTPLDPKKRTERKGSSASSVSTDTLKAGDPSKVKNIDSHLLLAFTFFDVNKTGYIRESDLEDVCLIMGLGLTRAQVSHSSQ